MPIDPQKYSQALETQRLQAIIRIADADEKIAVAKADRKRAEADLNAARGAQQMVAVLVAEGQQEEAKAQADFASTQPAAPETPSSDTPPPASYSPRVGEDGGMRPPPKPLPKKTAEL